jgi:hypothetical protein
MKTQDELLHIVRNGGSLDFPVGMRSTEELIQIVRNTKEKATVTLRGLGMRTADEFVQISRNSVGNVVFVLD